MTKYAETPTGEIIGASQRFFVACGDDASVVAKQINSDPGFVERLAAFAKSGGHQPSTSQKEARKIMGTNFFGVEEAMRHFGVNPSREQVAALAEVPFSGKVLRAYKDTHVLVAVFPLSILDIRAKTGHLFYKQDWFNKQDFAKSKGEVGWHLVRKVPVADSTSKTWPEQQALLSKDEETPNARVVVYTIIGHFFATGERLFECVYVRCADLDSDGARVLVGLFDAGGLGVYNGWDDYRYGLVGVSSARKF